MKLRAYHEETYGLPRVLEKIWRDLMVIISAAGQEERGETAADIEKLSYGTEAMPFAKASSIKPHHTQTQRALWASSKYQAPPVLRGGPTITP